MYRTLLLAFLLCFHTPLRAIDPGRDFSGKWFLDTRGSNFRSLSFEPEPSLEVVQQDDAIRCWSGASHWSYALNGKESRYRIGKEERNSVVKWEGDALLINTLVSGSPNYTVMDRWRLSANHSTLTVARQIVQVSGQSDGVLVYRRDMPAPVVERPVERTPERTPDVRPEEKLVKRPDPPPAATEVADILVRAGTRIPMVFLNDVDTKHSHEGDRIYLHTSFPIVVNSRVVIPKGSAVTGVVTQTKRPGRVAGKGELFIRFDSLTLPNGVTRDLRSRLGSVDGTAGGQVDPKEGKVTGEGNRAGDARRVGTGAMGGVTGVAGGLASVLLSRGPDATLRRGTNVEMILDRDLVYRTDELR